MMMPASPRPNLILCQARLALGSSKTFFHLARSSAPLPCHADRRLALFENAGGVDDQHAVGPSDRRADLPDQLVDHRRSLPGLLANELLHRLSILLVKVGDGFHILAFYVGDQTGDVFGGVPPLDIVFQTGRERFDKLVKPLKYALQDLGFDASYSPRRTV